MATQEKPVSGILLKTQSILDAIYTSEKGSLTLTEISEFTSISPASVHRIIQSLLEIQFLTVDAEAKRYSLGTFLKKIAPSALRTLSFEQLVIPYLERISEFSNETAAVSLLQSGFQIFTNQVLSRQNFKASVTLGAPYPLYAGASSKVILANMSDESINQYLSGAKFYPLTTKTITNKSILWTEVHKIREQGFAFSNSERENNTASIAVPIFSANKTIFGSLSILGPSTRFVDNIERSTALRLIEYGHSLSEELGFQQL